MDNQHRAGIDLNFTFGAPSPDRRRPDPELPMRILVIGDFGGRGTRGKLQPLGQAKARKVDADNFDELLKSIGPQIELKPGDGPAVAITVGELDALHPDKLFETLEMFAPIRKLRGELLNPGTFARAAAALSCADEPPAQPVATGKESDNDAMSRLLGRPAAGPSRPVESSGGLDSLIRRIVAPHVVTGPDPRQADLVASVDDMAGACMRAVLHDPAFQSVEATWRGLDWLVRNLELDETLQLSVLDASLAELRDDLGAVQDVAQSGLYRAVSGAGDSAPWSLLVMLFSFGVSDQDVETVAKLGLVGQQCGAPILAAADSVPWLGHDAGERNDAWERLRGLAQSEWVGLALPRILLRMPYGKKTDPIDRFAFEEQLVPPDSCGYLWANGALGCARLIAQSFVDAGGWEFELGERSEVSDLVIHTFKDGGESTQTPCAERWLTEANASALLAQGLMPIVSIAGRGAAKVLRFQSIARPSRRLAGRWQ